MCEVLSWGAEFVGLNKITACALSLADITGKKERTRQAVYV